MKTLLATIFLFSLSLGLVAQSNVGIGTTTPNSNAQLEIKSNSKGLLIPRLTSAQRTGMSLGTMDEGMMVYDLTDQDYKYFDGTSWNSVSTSGSNWNVNGDNLWYTSGNVGIGTNNPTLGRLQVVTPLVNVTGRFANNFTSDVQNSFAIYAVNTAKGAHDRYGVYGLTKGSINGTKIYGMYGEADPVGQPMDAYGGFFWTKNTGVGVHYGVFAQAQGANAYGLYAKNTFAAGYAGFFEGKVAITNRLSVGKDTAFSAVDIVANTAKAIDVHNQSALNDTIYGMNILVDGNNNNTMMGINTKIVPTAANIENVFGMKVEMEDVGPGVKYGVNVTAFGNDNFGVRARSSGTGRAIVGVNNNTNGYAGYFEGRSFFTTRIDISDHILLKPEGHGFGGEIELYDDDGDQNVTIRASQTSSNGAEMLMYNEAAELTLELDADYNNGNSRIITDELQIKGGADLAENFHIVNTATEILPGMVVSIDEKKEGALKASSENYDTKVVGVVSGANGITPGMIMEQEGSIADGDYPIALTGRVYVLADASEHAIEPGDMLTSSDLQGYAMLAKNKRKANGSTIGKALTGLNQGKGYVLMLVNLK